jgi:hypothetical protein
VSITWQPGITLEQLEKQVILKALQFFGGNKTRTAQSLDIAIRTLDNKLEKYEREQNASVQTEGRIHLEPDAETPPQRPMPMREREEVQEVSPAAIAARSGRQGKRT